jgi:DNA-directed RNA polymerase specialized sigma24 family protein
MTTPELYSFRAWLRAPANRVAWDALEARQHPVDRFVVRPQTERFKVVDIWTGETAVIAMTPQDGMSEEDARHIARLLNGRAAGGDRSILQ